jgi:hypothetical protein
MAATVGPLEFGKHESWVFDVTVDMEGELDGAISIKWILRRFGEEILVAELDNGVTVTDSTAHVCRVELPPPGDDVDVGMHDHVMRVDLGGEVVEQIIGLFMVRG